MELMTQAYDSAEYLGSDEAIEEYVAAAFETGDASFIAKALGTVARAKNMSQLARDTGMSRSALYRSLSGDVNLEFTTLLKIMDALGLKLTPVRLDSGQDAA